MNKIVSKEQFSEKVFKFEIEAPLIAKARKAGHFLLEGRYYYGLSDIFGNGKSDVFGRSANGTIIIKASYLFDIIRTKRKPVED